MGDMKRAEQARRLADDARFLAEAIERCSCDPDNNVYEDDCRIADEMNRVARSYKTVMGF